MIKKPALKKIAEYLADTKSLRIAKDQLASYQHLQKKCMTTKKRSYDTIIERQSEIVENLQLQVNRDKCDLSRFVRIEGDHFMIFYLHYVKNRTLQQVADYTHYTKDGVVKILQRIKKKCTQLNG